MRHSGRHGVSKRGSAKGFRRDVGRTHSKNMRLRPARGGWRL